MFRGTFDFTSEPFDWGTDYHRPNLPWQDLIVYEMPIRSFTADPSSGVGEGLQGTFAGAAAKVGPALIKYLAQPCCRGARQGASAGAEAIAGAAVHAQRRPVVHP